MKLFKKFGRYAVCILLVTAFFLLYVGRLFQWQIIDGDVYAEEALNDLTDVIELDAARGQLLDRNGKVLAGNRTTYNIVCNALEMDLSKRNATIIRVLNLLAAQEEEWVDPLPILLDGNGNYVFAEDREDEVAALKSQDMLNLADYATADDCMRELADWFNCGGFSREDSRNVASVRYGMYRSGFSRTNPYVLARGVSAETVGIVNQRSGEWPGIETRVSVARYYGEEGDIAPHVVGYTGLIRQSQLDAAKENGQLYSRDNISGYTWNDVVGRSGLEEAFEEELRGKRGVETIYNDDNGDVRNTAVTVQPEEGHTVYTTLDTDLQRVANMSLARNIRANTEARNCVAGAAVALDVKTFGVLACSSYPDYDLNLFTTDNDYYNRMNSDLTRKPLFDRALTGVFTPGSIFKPLVALAALQEGTLSAGTTYYCDGSFDLGEDEATALHLKCICGQGDRNVYGGLAFSCNTFFCTAGVNLTIRRMDAYAECFGLGEYTGVELTEYAGTMSNPQEYEANHGRVWMEDATAQAAIGQADNAFTPIQLATYCATIANGGKRLQTHFLDKVTDYQGKEVLRRYEPKQLADAGLTADVLGVVREGMMGSASYGTARHVFSDYPIAIACKTGTAEVALDHYKEPNLTFICYAPANDPQIAVAVVMEEGNSGVYAQNVAKDILDQYFGFYTWDKDGNRYNSGGDLVDSEGKVLKTKAELDAEQARREEQEQNRFLGSLGNSSASAAPTPLPLPTATPAPERDEIPDQPYTGEPSAAPIPETPRPAAGSTPAPGGTSSPYYSGRASRPPGG